MSGRWVRVVPEGEGGESDPDHRSERVAELVARLQNWSDPMNGSVRDEIARALAALAAENARLAAPISAEDVQAAVGPYGVYFADESEFEADDYARIAAALNARRPR